MPPPPRQPRPGDTLGRYRLTSVLGVGGMGVVYAATDTRLGRDVAVKVMSGSVADAPGFRARFDREATTLARLDSPHVVAVHDHGEHPPGPGGAPYLVTQLVPGGDLGTLLRRRGPLPPHLAVDVCAQVAEALRDAHAAGVAHRDLTPANVLLRDPDASEVWAYLSDFGIAVADDVDATRPAGVAPTTPALDRAADVHALGGLLWSALTGLPPGDGTPRLHGSDAFTDVANRFLARTTAADPARRPDAAAARAELLALAGTPAPRDPASWAAGVPTDPAAPTDPTRQRPAASRPRPRRTPLLAATALLLVVGATTAAVALTRDDEPAPDAGPAAPPTPAEPDAPVTGDVDGDGLGDLRLQVGRTNAAERLTWLSDGTDAAAEPEVAPGTAGVTLRGDFEGDGGLDDLGLFFGERRTVVDVDYSRTVDTQYRLDNLPPATLYPSAADLDGDGLDDLAMWGSDGERLRLWHYRFMPRPSLYGPREARLPDVREGRIETGDFDGDGRAELILVDDAEESAEGSRVRILESDERRTAYTTSGEPTYVEARGPDDETSLRAGDYDGDGDDELLASTIGDGEQRIELWSVEGPDDDHELVVEEVYVGPAPEGGEDTAARLSTSDVDGDGDDDLLVPSAEPGALVVRLLLAEDGGFTDRGEWVRWDCADRCDAETRLVDRAP